LAKLSKHPHPSPKTLSTYLTCKTENIRDFLILDGKTETKIMSFSPRGHNDNKTLALTRNNNPSGLEGDELAKSEGNLSSAA
jgi:hypothetical protein